MEEQYILNQEVFNVVYPKYLSGVVFWREEGKDIIVKTSSKYGKGVLTGLVEKDLAIKKD